MPRYITLNLVNEQGTPHPWPGTETLFEIGSQVSTAPVWIGVSADGLNNQVYPLSTDHATILSAWPRLYQGVQINQLTPGDDSPSAVGPGEFVYYASLTEFNRLVAACCIATQVDESPTESPSEPVEPPFDIMAIADFPDPDQSLSMWLIFFSPSQFFVDWGDGSPEEEFNGDNVTAEHQYAAPGEYTARVRLTTPGDLSQFELVNTPLTLINFNPATTFAIATINLQNNGLTDDAIGNLPDAIALILADNQLTPAILATLPIVTTLNLSNNPLAGLNLNNLNENVGNLYINTVGINALDLTQLNHLLFPLVELQAAFNTINSIDLTPFDTSSLNALNLQGNGLDTFTFIGAGNFPEMLNLNLANNELDGNDVDNILIALDTAGLNNGTVNLSGQTPAAPPTVGIGTVAQVSLESKGWTVTVD